MLSFARKHTRSLESQSLLSPAASSQDESDIDDSTTNTTTCCSKPRGICLTSKPIILVLVWTMLVGAMYSIAFGFAMTLLFDLLPLHLYMSLPFLVFYSSVALLNLFYPLNGLLADVCFGRFKTLLASISLLLISFIVCLTCSALTFHLKLSNNLKGPLNIVSGVSLLTLCVGIAGYCANFIQFGLDQLLEAPSHHQALFVHWAKWCYDLASAIVIIIAICKSSDRSSIDVHTGLLFIFSCGFFLCISLLLLLFTCWKHHWFYSEPGQRNPYKMTVMVLNFARRHKYPLQRSAFTYCDDERPSRLDYAKMRFGGPFTTEQVEDVKTFLRIVVVLITIGSVFVMGIPASHIAMYVLGVHFGNSELSNSWMWKLVNCSLLRNLTSIVFLPIYMWITFSLLQNRVPRIFYRLGCGILIYFIGVLSVFVIDIVGHAQLHYKSECIFNLTYNHSTHQFNIPHLGMHWAVYIPSNILIGIGPQLVTVTIFEFISAQSPHSMKGLLLGTYYAIEGFYRFISSVMLVPVSVNSIWENELYPPNTGCLFGYLLSTCTIGLVGFVLYLLAAKWYVYRQRDDRPYDQRFVIDYYNRYLGRDDDPLSDEYESINFITD